MISLKKLLFESSSDDEYYEFIKNDDIDSLKKIIELNAKNKGYNVGPVYHKTNQKFNKIDTSKLSKSSVWGPAFYAVISGTWNPGHLSKGELIEGYVGGNIINFTQPLKKEDIVRLSNFIKRPVEAMPFITLEKRFGSVSNGLLQAGYSAAIHKGPGETGLHIAIFDPKMFKLSDLITYDDNKQIIPLSQRFDSSTEDIRY